MNFNGFISVGKIVGWFGTKGYMKVKPFDETASDLSDAEAVYMEGNGQSVERFLIEDLIIRNRTVLIKLEGIDSLTEAESFKNRLLLRTESELLPLPEDKVYIHDLIGWDAVLETGEPVGIVRDVFRSPAHDLWEIKNGARIYLIPVVKEFVRSLDRKQRRVIVRLIDGIME